MNLNFARIPSPGPRRLAAACACFSILCGCGHRPHAESLLGNWRGLQTAGSVTAASHWQFRADGTDTITLTLPQGALTAQGTWMLHDETLTLRTTRRAVAVGGPQKTMPLVNPMETLYHCAVAGDLVQLARPGTGETITLTRDDHQTP